jgi:hypothetical protein
MNNFIIDKFLQLPLEERNKILNEFNIIDCKKYSIYSDLIENNDSFVKYSSIKTFGNIKDVKIDYDINKFQKVDYIITDKHIIFTCYKNNNYNGPSELILHYNINNKKLINIPIINLFF